METQGGICKKWVVIVFVVCVCARAYGGMTPEDLRAYADEYVDRAGLKWSMDKTAGSIEIPGHPGYCTVTKVPYCVQTMKASQDHEAGIWQQKVGGGGPGSKSPDQQKATTSKGSSTQASNEPASIGSGSDPSAGGEDLSKYQGQLLRDGDKICKFMDLYFGCNPKTKQTVANKTTILPNEGYGDELEIPVKFTDGKASGTGEPRKYTYESPYKAQAPGLTFEQIFPYGVKEIAGTLDEDRAVVRIKPITRVAGKASDDDAYTPDDLYGRMAMGDPETAGGFFYAIEHCEGRGVTAWNPFTGQKESTLVKQLEKAGAPRVVVTFKPRPTKSKTEAQILEEWKAAGYGMNAPCDLFHADTTHYSGRTPYDKDGPTTSYPSIVTAAINPFLMIRSFAGCFCYFLGVTNKNAKSVVPDGYAAKNGIDDGNGGKHWEFASSGFRKFRVTEDNKKRMNKFLAQLPEDVRTEEKLAILFPQMDKDNLKELTKIIDLQGLAEIEPRGPHVNGRSDIDGCSEAHNMEAKMAQYGKLPKTLSFIGIITSPDPRWTPVQSAIVNAYKLGDDPRDHGSASAKRVNHLCRIAGSGEIINSKDGSKATAEQIAKNKKDEEDKKAALPGDDEPKTADALELPGQLPKRLTSCDEEPLQENYNTRQVSVPDLWWPENDPNLGKDNGAVAGAGNANEKTQTAAADRDPNKGFF